MTGIPRRASASDRDAIERCMKSSARALGRPFYDDRQNESFVAHVAVVDDQLVADGTYFVVEAESGAVVACGGWSRRDKLFTGNDGAAGGGRLLDPSHEPARVRAMFVAPEAARRGLGRRILETCEGDARREGFVTGELMATLPGVPLYRACGYEDVEPFDVVLPDGVKLPCIRMRKSLG
ncbi:MAG: GNAT family N-acetyltransferase [Labilithrix sp.]|nr:GNAT family N-acetyltransferase [Labilithrix sp.]